VFALASATAQVHCRRRTLVIRAAWRKRVPTTSEETQECPRITRHGQIRVNAQCKSLSLVPRTCSPVRVGVLASFEPEESSYARIDLTSLELCPGYILADRIALSFVNSTAPLRSCPWRHGRGEVRLLRILRGPSLSDVDHKHRLSTAIKVVEMVLCLGATLISGRAFACRLMVG
jgi:hypothetical protein